MRKKGDDDVVNNFKEALSPGFYHQTQGKATDVPWLTSCLTVVIGFEPEIMFV